MRQHVDDAPAAGAQGAQHTCLRDIGGEALREGAGHAALAQQVRRRDQQRFAHAAVAHVLLHIQHHQGRGVRGRASHHDFSDRVPGAVVAQRQEIGLLHLQHQKIVGDGGEPVAVQPCNKGVLVLRGLQGDGGELTPHGRLRVANGQGEDILLPRVPGLEAVLVVKGDQVKLRRRDLGINAAL